MSLIIKTEEQSQRMLAERAVADAVRHEGGRIVEPQKPQPDPYALQNAILRAFGLTAEHRVTRIVIEVAVNALPTVSITRLVLDEEANELREIVGVMSLGGF